MVEAITSRPPPQLKPRLVIRSSKSKMSSGFGRKVPCIFCERVVLQSHMTKHISLCHDKALQLYCLSCEKKCFGEPNFSLEGKIKVMTYKCHICKKIHVNHILDELLETIQTEKQQVALKAILSVKEKKDIGF